MFIGPHARAPCTPGRMTGLPAARRAVQRRPSLPTLHPSAPVPRPPFASSGTSCDRCHLQRRLWRARHPRMSERAPSSFLRLLHRGLLGSLLGLSAPVAYQDVRRRSRATTPISLAHLGMRRLRSANDGGVATARVSVGTEFAADGRPPFAHRPSSALVRSPSSPVHTPER